MGLASGTPERFAPNSQRTETQAPQIAARKNSSATSFATFSVHQVRFRDRAGIDRRGTVGESQPQLRITNEGDVYLRKMLGISQLLSQPIEKGLGQTKPGYSHQPEKEIDVKQLSSKTICGLPAEVLITMAIAAALMGLTVLPAVADDKGCSDASLKGDYAYEVIGTAVTLPPAGPVGILGKITLDGNGAFSGSVNGSIAGVIQLTDVPVTGTYSVASDCTGTLTTNYPGVTVHFNLVLVEGAKGRNAAELVSGETGPATGTLNPVSIHSGRGERFSD